MNPTAFFQGPLFTSGLLSLLYAIHVRRSAAASAAFGALAGVAAQNPALTPVVLVLSAAAVLTLRRAPRPSAFSLAAGALSFLAAVLPAIPDLDSLRAMREDYAATRGQWAGLEAVLLGQRTPFDVPELWRAGRRGLLTCRSGSRSRPSRSRALRSGCGATRSSTRSAPVSRPRSPPAGGVGRDAEAARHFERALALLPANPDGHYALGVLLEQSGRTAEAVGHYREALRLRPGWDEPAAGLARTGAGSP